MKERLKIYLAYVLTFLIMAVGVISLFVYVKEVEGAGITVISFMSALGVILVFHPAIDYWLETVKRTLKIEKKD